MTDAPPPPVPAAPAPKKGLSTGAIVAILLGGIVALFLLVGLAIAVILPIFASQSIQADASNAKADVATLGKEVAIYWVDNSEPPLITEADGVVVIEGPTGTAAQVTLSSGVALGAYRIDSSTSWCISVIAQNAGYQSFQYSASGGLEAGSC